MKVTSNFPESNANKVGNLIVYLADRLDKMNKKLYVTRLLKLLFIIDETAVRETGVPVTGLNYRVWKMGPVAYEVYSEFSHGKGHRFASHAEVRKDNQNNSQVVSLNKFDDSEFSDYEIEMIDRVIDKYSRLDGQALIGLLHEEGGLWANAVKEHNLENFFVNESTTKYVIDLSKVIDNDPVKLSRYHSSLASLNL